MATFNNAVEWVEKEGRTIFRVRSPKCILTPDDLQADDWVVEPSGYIRRVADVT